VKTVAILPVKSFDRAKSRLGGTSRADLAAAMAHDVLDALERVRGLAQVIVVSSEPRLAGARAVIVEDPHEVGHVDAALIGIRRAVEQGAGRVLLVPGDCPGIDPVEVEALLAGGSPASATIVPDRHGSGTNALLIAPPLAMLPSFGPGSFARHAALARAAGLQVHVESPPSLTHDVDTLADLDSLVALASAHGTARRTRALVGRASFSR